MQNSKSSRITIPELLAPAGGLIQLAAALSAGADAVYVGLGLLNARVSARGFSWDELARGCELAHAQGARVYAAINIFIFDSEFDYACELVKRALTCGVDAFIVADLGLIKELRATFKDIEIHLSTQAGVHSLEGLELLSRELGIKRACVARELSVPEIAELCTSGVDIEVFCHGAICISYSGECSFSALRRGRSAMRGDCTQPCRSSYELVDAEGKSVKAVEGDKLLCPHDYLGIAHLEELCQAGVASLKIEGRMKGADYVYNVVSVYREALDCIAAGKPYDAEAFTEQLSRSFNRGFTDIYLRGAKADAGLMSFERSINQGVRIGCITETAYQKIYVALDKDVHVGDTLEVRFYPGENTRPDAPKRWPQLSCPVDAHAGETIFLRCKRKVEAGSEVYLTRDEHLVSRAQSAVEELLATQAKSKPQGSSSEREHNLELRSDEIVETLKGTWPATDAVMLEEILRSNNRAATLVKIEAAKDAGSEVVCRNIAQVKLCQDAGVTFSVAKPIFCANSHTEELLRQWGAQHIYMDDPTRELMIMEHCVLTAEGPCSKDCVNCTRRKTQRYLIEQDGGRVRIEVDANGRTRLYAETKANA